MFRLFARQPLGQIWQHGLVYMRKQRGDANKRRDASAPTRSGAGLNQGLPLTLPHPKGNGGQYEDETKCHAPGPSTVERIGLAPEPN